MNEPGYNNYFDFLCHHRLIAMRLFNWFNALNAQISKYLFFSRHREPKVSKSQKYFYLKRHGPKNERNTCQNFALIHGAGVCLIIYFKKDCF